MKKLIYLLSALIIFTVVAMPVKVANADEIEFDYKDYVNTNYNYSNVYKERVYSARDTIPTVYIDDIVEWTNRKGFEIVHFLQIIIQPLTIIIFIIAAFLLLFGSIGSGEVAGRGLFGMVTSVVVYALVLYAPLIMNLFVGWISY